MTGAAEESVSGRPGGLLCGLFALQLSVGEDVSVDEVGDELVAIETTPVAFGLRREFEDHGQDGDAGAAALGLPATVADRGESRLDGVGRA